MGFHDAQQVCINGHQITDNYHRSPEFRRSFCHNCGAKTIHQCPSCGNDIKGDYHVNGVVAIGFPTTPVPKFCEKCGAQFPWADKTADDGDEVTKLDPVVSVERLCNRIALVVRQLRARHDSRQTLNVGDEYDVQDLLHALVALILR